MSIKVQLVTALIPATLTFVDVTAFTPVSALNRAFLLPISSNQHCGLGAGSSQMRTYWATADLTALGTIRFQRGGSSGDCIVGCWLVEFTGQVGDVDEFIVEKKTITFADSANSADSSALSTITDVAKTVPILHCRTNNNSTENAGPVACGIEFATSGLNDINRVTRLSISGIPTCIVYNVQWLHSLTQVQSGQIIEHNPPNTDRDTAITSVGSRDNAFVYSVYKNQNNPDDTTYYAWLANDTTMRSRALQVGATSDTLYWWVVSNPTFSVQHISAVDGVIDWTGGDGTASQTEHVPIDPIDQSRSCIIGHAGSSGANNNDHPAGCWGFIFSADDEVEASRTKNLGDSEYALMVIEFQGASAVQFPPAMRRFQNTLLRM